VAVARTDHPTDPLFHEPEPDDLSTHRHRLVIGVLGAALPLLVWLVGWIRPVDPALPVPLTSISAYYYSGAVAIFAGILACLAVYFITYDGYDNADRWKDRLASWIAAVAAIFVALFPTDAPSMSLALPWWSKEMGWVHLISAATLFGAFVFFALFLFPKSAKRGEALSRGKRLRNVVYRVCGVVMLVCVVWAGIRALYRRPIFLLEAIALEAFAVSWLVKGRAAVAAANIVRAGRHPMKLAAQVLDLAPRSGRQHPEP
jgi:hypothetical protein